MANTEVVIPAKTISSRMVMNVTVSGMRTWRWRMWTGLQLLKLAAFVAGCGIQIDLESRERL